MQVPPSSPAGLVTRLEYLEAKLAVTEVVTRYGLCVDRGDAEATAALYTKDAILDLGGDSQFSGTEGVRSLVLGPRHQAIVGRCAHAMGPFVVEVVGECATATGYARVYVQAPDEGSPTLWRMSFTRLELIREGGEWKIARRTSRVIGDPEGPAPSDTSDTHADHTSK